MSHQFHILIESWACLLACLLQKALPELVANVKLSPLGPAEVISEAAHLGRQTKMLRVREEIHMSCQETPARICRQSSALFSLTFFTELHASEPNC